MKLSHNVEMGRDMFSQIGNLKEDEGDNLLS